MCMYFLCGATERQCGINDEWSSSSLMTPFKHFLSAELKPSLVIAFRLFIELTSDFTANIIHDYKSIIMHLRSQVKNENKVLY